MKNACPMKKVAFLCTVFLLTAFLAGCESSLVTDLLARSGDRLFWDDFSNTSGGWPQITDSAGTLGYVSGSYQISIGSVTNQLLWAFSGHAYRDARVEVDATRLGGPAQNMFGLACRAAPQDQSYRFYFFIISSDGYYGIGKLENKKVSLLGQQMMLFSPDIVPAGGMNHLRFDCVGQTLSGYINGQAVALTHDGDFSDGDAGLLAGTFDTPGVQVSFDNFVVVKP